MTLVLLRNADVFAPQPLGMQNLLIGGGRDSLDGSRIPSSCRPRCAAVCQDVDLDGLRLIPGLIDGHVHVTGGGGEAGFRTRVPPVPLSRFTTAGVTTVVGLLGTDDVTRGPGELLATLYALREEGLNAYGYAGGYHVPPATLTGSVRGDLVFIEPLIGIGEIAISDHRSSQPTLDELLRLASECHVAGLMTGKAGILHLHLGDGPRGLELVRGALDGQRAAGARLQSDAREPQARCSTRRSSWRAAARPSTSPRFRSTRARTPTRLTRRLRVSRERRAGGARHDQFGRRWLPALLRRRRPCLAHGRRFLGRPARNAASAAGARSRLDAALPAFTSNPARLLRLATKGRIAAGHDADLVVLDATGGATQ